MARLSPARRIVVLDAGAISAIAEGSPKARAVLVHARRDGWLVVIPTPVLAEVHTGKRHHAAIDRVVNAVDQEIATTAQRAREAGVLRAVSGVLDVVDAIVVAEAVAARPAVIVTSDPDDIRRLLDAAGVTARDVVVIAV